MGSGANGGSPNLAFITGFPTPSPRMNRPPAAWSSCAAPLPGYLNDPEATARSLTTDGFYRTGDVGTIKHLPVSYRGSTEAKSRRINNSGHLR